MLHGMINVYKEAGYTSHDVVAKLRGICGQRKIGHTGTLDPDAVGVLPVCLGSGTKLCDMFTEKEKEYVTELLLGVVTDTQDTTGTVLSKQEVMVTEEEVKDTVFRYLGTYQQIPPMYSALKVNGKRLYELAREGKEVERKARPVTIAELEILEWKLPRVKMRVVCSKGTYIRTLCADIGESLGCGAAMDSLIRTRVGMFRIQDAVTLDILQKWKDEGTLQQKIYPVDSMFAANPALHVKEEHRKRIANGNAFYPHQTLEDETYPSGEWVRIYDKQGQFYGIYAYNQEENRYCPVKMFLAEENKA